MSFHLNESVSVTRDADGVVRALEHLQRPFHVAPGLTPAHPRSLADDYLRKTNHIFGIPPAWISRLSAPIANQPIGEGTRLAFAQEQSRIATTIVSYQQTVLGLPIWESGFSLTVLPSPTRATSAVSTVKYDVTIKKPSPKTPLLHDISVDLLQRIIDPDFEARRLHITSTRLLVYQYDPANRQEGGQQGQPNSPPSISLAAGHAITLPLPHVAGSIVAGNFYVVREVLFTYPYGGLGNINWRVFIEVESDSVLYLRALASGVQGYVFLHDPITTAGGTAPLPTATDAQLDPYRSLVTFPGLITSNPQALAGDYVKVGELSPPVIAPPTGSFEFDVDADGFAATNAYYHVENLFRMIDQLGYGVKNLFPNTSFPVTVDQSGETGVNAHSLSNATGTGSGGITFGHAADTGTVGIAADFRVVAHEFCHAILWECVHSPNFGFAHSAGDSLGIILSDPVSLAPDRYLTFPWIGDVSRRHDRAVSDGWAFGGSQYDTGYNGEQCLSTTLFRAYLAIGGAATSATLSTWFETRQWASQYLVYLLVGGIAGLGPSPIVPSPTADIYATAMMNADAKVLGFDGQPGGAIRKVIRWAFEQQGVYQPPGAPTPVTTVGAPPDVDVYIDDGRGGEYDYLPMFWETQDIWNRLSPDGGAAHQTPIVDVINYGYVRVKNRGTKTATNVVVSGYHVRPSSGLVWPDTYTTMETASVAAPDIPSNGSVVVGPFAWVPTEIGHECMLMSVSTPDDRSNIDPATSLACAAGPLPDYRFVPFDNNIAQRNVAPVAGGGGVSGLVASMQGKQFWVNNPYERVARGAIDIQLPQFLQRRGWQISARSEVGGDKFTLGPRAAQRFTLHVKPGSDFTPAEVGADPAIIRVLTTIDGIIVGGMSYAVDAALKTPPRERGSGGECKGQGEHDCKCHDENKCKWHEKGDCEEREREICTCHHGPERKRREEDECKDSDCDDYKDRSGADYRVRNRQDYKGDLFKFWGLDISQDCEKIAVELTLRKKHCC